MVFLIATGCALWYFGQDDKNYLCTGLRWIFGSHLGSLTFASIIITIVTLLKNAVQRQGQQGNCNAYVLCCLLCCISVIEDIIKTLNNNAIIVMTVTGESFINSAKHAIYLIMYKFGLFAISDAIGTLIMLCGMVFIAGIPAIIGYFLLKRVNPDESFVTTGMALIIFSAIMIGLLFLSVITESLSSVFIFYCMDRRLGQLRMGNNAPA